MEFGFNLILGAGCIAYGIYTLIARQLRPQRFEKLQAMQQKYGSKIGLGIHVIGYSLVPILAGVLILVGYFRALAP